MGKWLEGGKGSDNGEGKDKDVRAASIRRMGHGAKIAFHNVAGRGPGVLFLGGFKSDMEGTKALALQSLCARHGRAFTRFDYSGHGHSSGRFEDGTISDWLADSLGVLDEITEGPQILVGSSMGGWLALLSALARPDRVQGLVLVAPAPDFTEKLMWQTFSDDIQQTILKTGRYEQPSAYSDAPYVLTRALIEDGRRHLLLDAPIPIRCPVRILHGQQDEDVPWHMSFALMDRLESADVVVTIIKSGDHRLSTDSDITRLGATLQELWA